VESDIIRLSDRTLTTDILATYREIYPDLEKVISQILPRLGRVF